MPSFDIVCKLDIQEVDNAVNMAKKELLTRFDFKGSKASIEIIDKVITLVADDDYKLKQLTDILESKMTKRGISLLLLDYQKTEDATLGTIRQKINLKSGINKEDAKKITNAIRELAVKVQPQIMDDQVRVSAKKIDDLQTVIQELRGKTDLGLPLQFINMRS